MILAEGWVIWDSTPPPPHFGGVTESRPYIGVIYATEGEALKERELLAPYLWARTRVIRVKITTEE